MVNRMWKESLPQEHPLVTFARLKRWNQATLNDFVYDYAKREVVCDYPVNDFGAIMRDERNRLAQTEPRLLWRQYTMLDRVDEKRGHYACPDNFAPQDYGFNVIPLHPTSKTVRVKFRGHTSVNGTAGWRYGFVAVKQDGKTARYESPGKKDEGELTINLEPDEQALYLVVVGAPTEHTDYVWEPGWPKIKRYPYEVRILGAVPEGYQPEFRKQHKIRGAPHPNGGGWVADTARVAPSAYVGPHAVVMGHAEVTDQVRIDGTAWLENATVQDRVVIDGNANVFGGQFAGDAHVTGNAVVNDCNVRDKALLGGTALLHGGAFGGTIVVGGDAEIGGGDSGVYLQCPHGNNGRLEGDGEGSEHPSNQDINAPVQPFTAREMRFRDET